MIDGSPQKPSLPKTRASRRWWLAVVATSLLAAWVFWRPLWTGGGLIGGDIYTYYFPQKVFYSERLRAGELPLWNNRAGFGYPLVAESQTGAFYPTTLLLYRFLDVNTAYSLNHLLHYILAFIFTGLYARSLGLSTVASLLAALVYTYGWFPARSCLEWAIIGGAWLPLSLWCVEQLIASLRLRFAWGLALATAMQLLAGHFHLAWITILLVLLYAVGRRTSFGPTGSCSIDGYDSDIPGSSEVLQRQPFSSSFAKPTLVGAALIAGFGLAAVQILPTWELKQRSQRRSVSAQHDPGVGVLPVGYLQQVVMPWKWYSPLIDRETELNRLARPYGVRTNHVEAHLYFGMFPLLLALVGVVNGFRRRDRRRLLWLVAGLVFLILATGLLNPLVRILPGFNFFEGLGRYTVATQLAVAVLGAAGFHDLLQRSQRPPRTAAAALCAAAALAAWNGLRLTGDAAFVAEQLSQPNLLFGDSRFAATLVDVILVSQLVLTPAAVLTWNASIHLSHGKSDGSGPRVKAVGPSVLAATVLVASTLEFWLVGRLVGYAQLVEDPPIRHIKQSPVAQLLVKEKQPPRILAPGANFPTVLGVSCWPIYLPFGPAAYASPEAQLPRSEQFFERGLLDQGQLQWLDLAGITHVLSFRPVRVVGRESPSEGHSAAADSDLRPSKSWARPPEYRQSNEARNLIHSGKSMATATDAITLSTGGPAAGSAQSSTPALQLQWAGIDPVLNSAWARGNQPIFLYRLVGCRGRLRWAGEKPEGALARIVRYDANRVVVDVETRQAGTLIFTDLQYPGWTVTVDGRSETPVSAAVQLQGPTVRGAQPSSGLDRFFRAVQLSPGRHRVVWSFRPKSLRNGIIVSVFTLMLLVIVTCWLARRSRRPSPALQVATPRKGSMREDATGRRRALPNEAFGKHGRSR